LSLHGLEELNGDSNIRIADFGTRSKMAITEGRGCKCSPKPADEWLQETKMFTTERNGFVAFAAIATVGAALLCGPVNAEFANVEVPTVKVYYGDLNLTNQAGVSALYRRLQSAAKQVCRPLVWGNEMTRGATRRACYNQALSEAVTKVNLELLSVLHRNASAPPRVS
jgi:UrcA family protein